MKFFNDDISNLPKNDLQIDSELNYDLNFISDIENELVKFSENSGYNLILYIKQNLL